MRTSGAPPPAMSARFLTRQRTTQSASCRERSDSSSVNALAPVQRMLIVRPGFLMPVTRTTLAPDLATSSTRSACPSLSSVKPSMSAIGLQPVDLQMKSTSSRSMSLTTMILSFIR